MQRGAALEHDGRVGTLDGTLDGSGEVVAGQNSGTFTLGAGLSLAANGTLVLAASSTTATLGGDLADDGSFGLIGGATPST